MFVKKKNDTVLHAKATTTLLPFLLEHIGGSRTGIKSLLSHRQVSVNGSILTRHDTPINVGDTITISSQRGNTELIHPKLRIIFEDDHLIVVEKKPGLLTVPTIVGSKETTAFSILKNYVRKQNSRACIYTVHRLDRETSGLLVFAKTPKLQEYMRTYWREIVTRRTYVAVADGRFGEKQGTITSWLTEDKRNAMVYSSPVDDGGQKAVTHYKVLKDSENYSLLELNLETGRTNQIRVHLASKGHPVTGDRKYGHGNEESPIDRLCLHARILEFIHPVTEQTVHFETPIPKEFSKIVAKRLPTEQSDKTETPR